MCTKNDQVVSESIHLIFTYLSLKEFIGFDVLFFFSSMKTVEFIHIFAYDYILINIHLLHNKVNKFEFAKHLSI